MNEIKEIEKTVLLNSQFNLILFRYECKKNHRLNAVHRTVNRG